MTKRCHVEEQYTDGDNLERLIELYKKKVHVCGNCNRLDKQYMYGGRCVYCKRKICESCTFSALNIPGDSVPYLCLQDLVCTPCSNARMKRILTWLLICKHTYIQNYVNKDVQKLICGLL